jgi:hypothetical protein
MKRIALFVVVALAVVSSPMRAQERLGSGAPSEQYGPGWTFTPTIGVAETYDTNVSLFSQGHAGNEDYIATFFPGADLHHGGKHSSLDMGYSGSFLDYQRFPALNRWDQRARFEMKQQQTARLGWSAHASGALLPTTDLVDLGGIPYRKVGAKTADGRVTVDYVLSAHNKISSSANMQLIEFERPDQAADVLRGGRIFESTNAWRHKISPRVALGADYAFRRAVVNGDREAFDFHTTEAAADFDISQNWSLQGGAGLVHLQETALTAARSGPAWRVTVDRSHAGTTFHIGYLRTFIPSFGFGGTVKAQDVSVGFRTPLARRLYLDASAVLRDNQPLTGIVTDPVAGPVEQLPLRSLRTHTIIGWEPQPWVKLEGFVALVQQTSLRAGGYLDRNRVGFQIVTSKPMRMQ